MGHCRRPLGGLRHICADGSQLDRCAYPSHRKRREDGQRGPGRLRFAELREYGYSIGFQWVESNPLVRSSYHAGEQVRALSVVHRKLYGEPMSSD